MADICRLKKVSVRNSSLQIPNFKPFQNSTSGFEMALFIIIVLKLSIMKNEESFPAKYTKDSEN